MYKEVINEKYIMPKMTKHFFMLCQSPVPTPGLSHENDTTPAPSPGNQTTATTRICDADAPDGKTFLI